MKSLIQSLANEIEQIEAGTANLSHLDNAVNQAQILLEKLYIVRYSAYKANVTPNTTTAAPVYDLSDADMLEENDVPLDLFRQESTPKEPKAMTQTEIPLETPTAEDASAEILETHIQETFEMINHEVSESIDEAQLDIHEILNTFANVKLNVSPLTGNYTLKEKLQYINVLFNGSSEDFSNAVKALDNAKDLVDATKHLKFLSEKHTWEQSNKDILTHFIEKVCASHAKP
jgi:hypothetical protein